MVESTAGVFSRAWQLLTANWIIIVPGIVVGIVSEIVRSLLGPHMVVTPDGGVTSIGGGFIMMQAAYLIQLVLFVASVTYTTGMAGAAWRTGTTTLSDGTVAFERDAGKVVVALIALFLLGWVALILSIPTFGLAMLAFIYFVVYTFPAAVIGEVPGIEAIKESVRIAQSRVSPTLTMIVAIAVIGIVVGIVTSALHVVPFLGPVIGGLIAGAASAYFTLVVAGEYLQLKAGGA
ncbi:MAG TPA: hypothetical protein VNJ51_10830 [Candidatus Dormibacteraeota bacterium]|nr:hypothetical protein [Candidatus Dormibacteraeota bacterium]